MPYRKVMFAAGGFYHVYNRGFLKKTIFKEVRDFRKFTHRLSVLITKLPFRLHAYCLMPNHFHLLLEQLKDNVPVSELMNKQLGSYGKYFNTKYQIKGAVFEGRFQAKEIQTDPSLLQVSKYIHRNPIEAGLVTRLIDYPWSSYPSFLGDVAEPMVRTAFLLEYFSSRQGKVRDFRAFVEESFAEGELLPLQNVLFRKQEQE